MSTLKAEDHFHSSIVENFALLENLHDQCFVKCAQRSDVSYLTMQEGLCFRNCLN